MASQLSPYTSISAYTLAPRERAVPQTGSLPGAYERSVLPEVEDRIGRGDFSLRALNSRVVALDEHIGPGDIPERYLVAYIEALGVLPAHHAQVHELLLQFWSTPGLDWWRYGGERLATLAREVDQPTNGQGLLAAWRHLDRDLVGRAANPTGSNVGIGPAVSPTQSATNHPACAARSSCSRKRPEP